MYLSDESVGLHCAVGIHLWHVHVIDEVDQFLGTGRAVVAPGLLLQRLLHHFLQHQRGGVVVERKGGHQYILIQACREGRGVPHIPVQ